MQTYMTQASSDPRGPLCSAPEDAGFRCSVKECENRAANPDEYAKCEACSLRCCPDCLVSYEGLLFCPACAVCACGKPSVGICDECGDLKCADHLKEVGECDHETGYRDVREVCRPCARRAA